MLRLLFTKSRTTYGISTHRYTLALLFTSTKAPPITVYKLNHKDWLSPSEVLKLFSDLKDPDSIISVLDQYSKRRDYKPNEALYSLVINQLAKAKSFEAIDHVMETVRAEKGKYPLSDAFFYNVIKIYGNVGGKIRKAIDILYDMPRFNCWPSVKTFNFVLNLIVSAKVFNVVHDVYLSAPRLGVDIDACSLNILIKGLCENGNLEGAFYVLDEFPKQNCKPNVRTFSTLMHGLCELGRIDEAFELVRRMEEYGVEADTVMFNILISGLRKQGRVEEGAELLERMKGEGCYPNAGSYQEVLYGLLDKGMYVEAKGVVSGMIREGMSPSFVSFKKLIHGFCMKMDVEDLDWVLKQMVQQDFVPRMGMWREIVRCVISGNSCSVSDRISELISP